MQIPSRPFVAPIKNKVTAGRSGPGHIIAPATNSPSNRPLLPIESSPIVQHSLPQTQETYDARNLLQSRNLRDRLTSRRLMGTYDQRLGDEARMLRTNILSKLPTLNELLSLVDGNSFKALDMLKTAAKQARQEGVLDELAVLRKLAGDVRAHQQRIARSRIVAPDSTDPGADDSRLRTNLRQLYSGKASTLNSVSGVVETLLNEKEAGQFTFKLQQMHKFITDDLAALAPAASQRQIRTIVHGINNLRYVSVLMRGCQHLVGRMRDKNPALKIEPVKFLQELLRLSAAGLQIDETQVFVTQIGGSQLKHKLSFLNALRPMLQELPILLWQDLEKRRSALGNLRELMTRLTNLELKQGALD